MFAVSDLVCVLFGDLAIPMRPFIFIYNIITLVQFSDQAGK